MKTAACLQRSNPLSLTSLRPLGLCSIPCVQCNLASLSDELTAADAIIAGAAGPMWGATAWCSAESVPSPFWAAALWDAGSMRCIAKPRFIISAGLGLLPNGVPAGSTIFAPSNSAVQDLARGQVTAQSVAALPDSTKAALAATVLYHILLGGLQSADQLAGAGGVTTALPGGNLSAADEGWLSSALVLTDATGTPAAVEGSPIQACGAEIYIVDAVLLPAGLLDPAFPSVTPEQGAAILAGSSAGAPLMGPSPEAWLPAEAPSAGGDGSGGDALTSLLTPGIQPGDVNFDYLLLSRQWGPTFCATTSCSRDA